ncbi:hypothetical protein D3C71_188960 [compost metagenome]
MRPGAGRLGRIAFRFLGIGMSPQQLLPLMAWIQSSGATDENDVTRLRGAFVKQLGPAWRSFHEASLVAQVLLLRAATAFIDPDRLKQIDESLMELMDRPFDLARDMADLSAVVRLHVDDRLVQWCESFEPYHGFESTVVLGAIRHVHRHKGLVAFRRYDMPWLPFVDRVYWASVHFSGRRQFMAECAGVFSHLLAETAARHAIREPQIDGAVEGIQRAWRERLVYSRLRGGWVRVEPDT